MTWLQRIYRALAVPLAVLLALSSLPLLPAQAALVSTERAIETERTETGAAAERARVMAFMARDEVRREFTALGVDADEATARVAALSDAEIRRIAGHIELEPAGQSAIVSITVALIVASVFVFAVLLITDILGLTDIFPFVRPANRRHR